MDDLGLASCFVRDSQVTGARWLFEETGKRGSLAPEFTLRGRSLPHRVQVPPFRMSFGLQATTLLWKYGSSPPSTIRLGGIRALRVQKGIGTELWQELVR